MTEPEVQRASFYIIWWPNLVLLSVLLAGVVFYVTHYRLGSGLRFSIAVSVIAAGIVVGVSVLLLFRSTVHRLPNELTMVAYGGLIFLAFLALARWEFGLRFALAVPVAAITSSVWLLAVWLATVGRHFR